MDSAATVDSVADDLKKQSLKETGKVEIKLKLNLEELNWDNSFVRELPGDPRSDSIPREVLHACYTKVLPSVPVNNPQLVAWSKSVAELLELDPRERVSKSLIYERPDFPLIFLGASPLVGAIPYAQNYGGHQFGMWAGQLGDGRALTLGEILIQSHKGGSCSLRVLERPPIVVLLMVLQCFIVAFENSFAVKQCTVLESQQHEDFV